MATFSRTWWGQRFIAALETFTDSARLGRGRSYAVNGKIKQYDIENSQIKAKVRGSVNPYFGVYKEPLYTTTIDIEPISEKNWSKAIAYLGSKASWVSKLLLNEIPDNIEEVFSDLGLHLLPRDRDDIHTSCSCPDWSNPCKHIAGVCYAVASELDSDPFLLFELRGISRSRLRQELAKTPLGEAVASALDTEEITIDAAQSYYTEPIEVALDKPCSLKDFWQPEKRLPSVTEASDRASIPAIAIKKGGDFPPFWELDTSFLTLMEELYSRVKTKNKF